MDDKQMNVSFGDWPITPEVYPCVTKNCFLRASTLFYTDDKKAVVALCSHHACRMYGAWEELNAAMLPICTAYEAAQHAFYLERSKLFSAFTETAINLTNPNPYAKEESK